MQHGFRQLWWLHLWPPPQHDNGRGWLHSSMATRRQVCQNCLQNLGKFLSTFPLLAIGLMFVAMMLTKERGHSLSTRKTEGTRGMFVPTLAWALMCSLVPSSLVAMRKIKRWVFLWLGMGTDFDSAMNCVNYISFQNLTTAVFYFRKDVKSTYEYFIFTMPILFAELGGYVGLLASNALIF